MSQQTYTNQAGQQQDAERWIIPVLTSILPSVISAVTRGTGYPPTQRDIAPPGAGQQQDERGWGWLKDVINAAVPIVLEAVRGTGQGQRFAPVLPSNIWSGGSPYTKPWGIPASPIVY